MEMPKPQPEHARLRSFAGTWTGEEKLHPSPWDPRGGQALARVTSRMAMDGFFLVTDYAQERQGKVSYEGHGVFGYEPGRRVYTLHWFDSMGSGTPEPATGTWSGDTLTFEQKSPMGWSRYIYRLEGETRYAFRIDHSRDGNEWTTFIEGRYTKT